MLRLRTVEAIRLLLTPGVLEMAAAPVVEATVDPRIRAVDPAVEATSLRLLPIPEVLGAEEEGAIPPLTAVGVGIPPLTRTPLAAVGVTRAEEKLPTRAPQAAPTTRLTTRPAAARWTTRPAAAR